MYKFTFTGVFLLLVLLSGCGSGGGDSSNSATGKQYLARNVVFNPNLVSSAHAQSYAIDTETQVLAENVIFENMSNSNIESGNVQDALEELSLILDEVMVGDWNIQNFNFGDNHESSGRVTIANDGTFDLTEGSFAAIGMGSGTGDPMCQHTQDNQTYESISNELIAFVHYYPMLSTAVRSSVIPRLVKLRENEIIFIGHGGCGAVGDSERVSILTRIVE
jgi:hypothetical protein